MRVGVGVGVGVGHTSLQILRNDVPQTGTVCPFPIGSNDCEAAIGSSRIQFGN